MDALGSFVPRSILGPIPKFSKLQKVQTEGLLCVDILGLSALQQKLVMGLGMRLCIES